MTVTRSFAFQYSLVAGTKSLGVYSLEEAERHFRKAIEIADARPDGATNAQLMFVVERFTYLLNLNTRSTELCALRGEVPALDRRTGTLPDLMLQSLQLCAPYEINVKDELPKRPRSRVVCRGASPRAAEMRIGLQHEHAVELGVLLDPGAVDGKAVALRVGEKATVALVANEALVQPLSCRSQRGDNGRAVGGVLLHLVEVRRTTVRRPASVTALAS